MGAYVCSDQIDLIAIGTNERRERRFIDLDCKVRAPAEVRVPEVCASLAIQLREASPLTTSESIVAFSLLLCYPLLVLVSLVPGMQPVRPQLAHLVPGLRLTRSCGGVLGTGGDQRGLNSYLVGCTLICACLCFLDTLSRLHRLLGHL